MIKKPKCEFAFRFLLDTRQFSFGNYRFQPRLRNRGTINASSRHYPYARIRKEMATFGRAARGHYDLHKGHRGARVAREALLVRVAQGRAQRGFRTCVLSHYGRDRDAGNAFQKNVRGTQIAGFTCVCHASPSSSVSFTRRPRAR